MVLKKLGHVRDRITTKLPCFSDFVGQRFGLFEPDDAPFRRQRVVPIGALESENLLDVKYRST